MCEAVGYPVVRLVRTRIGPVTDRRLRPGSWRHLTGGEVRTLALATQTAGDTEKARETQKARATRTAAGGPRPRVSPGQRPSPGGRRAPPG
jgi:23S rRNA pseudouridine2605 synthase